VLYQFYNVFFTFFPCVCFAVLDRPVQNLAELQWNPWSYVPGREKRFFNWQVLGMVACLLSMCSSSVYSLPSGLPLPLVGLS